MLTFFQDKIQSGEADDRVLHVCVHPANFPIIQFSTGISSLIQWLSIADQEYRFIETADAHILNTEQSEEGMAGMLVDFREGMLTAVNDLLTDPYATYITYQNDGDDGWISVSSISREHARKHLNLAEKEHNDTVPDESAKEFEDSVEATETFEDLQSALADPRLQHWLEITDTNYGSKLSPRLAQIRAQFDALMEDLYAVDD